MDGHDKFDISIYDAEWNTNSNNNGHQLNISRNSVALPEGRDRKEPFKGIENQRLQRFTFP